jgi:hypothetical protein
MKAEYLGSKGSLVDDRLSVAKIRRYFIEHIADGLSNEWFL